MSADGIEQKMPVRNVGLAPQAVSGVDDATSANLIELTGVIKWFDVAKGFGFIVPDNGMADVLLHVTCLRRDGFQTAHEGARVVGNRSQGEEEGGADPGSAGERGSE